jgi:CheY-like chemotaxis protein
MIRTVLVDDDLEIKTLAQTAAQKAGVGLVMFDNGADALKYLGHSTVDVAILDLMLPVIDGLTIAEEIRTNEEIRLIEPPIKIVFLTAAEITDAVKRIAERTRVEQIYTKPCDYYAMFNEIRMVPQRTHICLKRGS